MCVLDTKYPTCQATLKQLVACAGSCDGGVSYGGVTVSQAAENRNKARDTLNINDDPPFDGGGPRLRYVGIMIFIGLVICLNHAVY